MANRRSVAIVWGSIGALLVLIAVPLARPMTAAWRCLWLHDHAARERAVVLHKFDENGRFALQIEEGPNAGTACTAGTSQAIFDATSLGDRLEVVSVEWKPGRCELVTTIEASAHLLWWMSAVVGAVVAGLLVFGAALTRSFTRPAHPPRRMEAEPRDVRCPSCGKQMDEGYVPVLAGLHWRRLGEPLGLPHALSGMPGTVGWRGRPRLHAFRCVPCEILTVQYGNPPQPR